MSTTVQKLKATSKGGNSLLSKDKKKYTRNILCPICTQKGKGCMLFSSEDSSTWCVCVRSNHGDTFVRSQDNPVFGETYLHKLSSGYVKPISHHKYHKPIEPANTDIIHAAYTALKNRLSLSQDHKEQLDQWGIPKDYQDNFRTMPLGEYGSIVCEGIYAQGVPGFFMHGEKQLCKTMGGGLAHFPVDPTNKILCVEIRTKDSQNKYKPLSSSYAGGASALQTVSLIGQNKGDTIWITEGYKKGYSIWNHYEQPSLVLRGVGSWRQIKRALRQARSENPDIKNVILAIDMDRLNKDGRHRNVELAHIGLIEMLSNDGRFNLFVANWDDTFKGIDDCLNAGYAPNVGQVSSAICGDLNETRIGLYDQLYKLFKSGANKSTKGFHLFDVSAGVGKTTTMLKVLADTRAQGCWPTKKDKNGVSDQRVAFLANTKEQINKAFADLQDLGLEGFVKEGRNTDESSLWFCKYTREVNQAAAAGRNTQKAVCNHCDILTSCLQKHYKAGKSLAETRPLVLTTKDSFFSKSNPINDYQIVIIDEEIRKILYREDTYCLADIQKAIWGYTKAIAWMNRKGFLDKEATARKHLDLLCHILEWMQDQQASGIINPEHQQFNLVDLFDWHALLDEWNSELDHDFPVYPQDGVDDDDYCRDGRYFIPDIFTGLGDTRQLYATINGSRVQLHISRINPEYVYALRNKLVINLDATSNTFYTKMFECYKNFKTYSFKVKGHLRVNQIGRRKMSKEALKHSDTANRVVNALKFIKEKHGSIGIVTGKDFYKKYLEPSGFTLDEVVWYGKDNRWSNKLKNTSAIAMVGIYIQNLFSATREMNLLATQGIETIQADFLQHITAIEMIQGIERGRPVQRDEEEPLEVYVFSDVKLPGYPADTVFDTIENLMGQESPSQKQQREWAEKRHDRKTEEYTNRQNNLMLAFRNKFKIDPSVPDDQLKPYLNQEQLYAKLCEEKNKVLNKWQSENQDVGVDQKERAPCFYSDETKMIKSIVNTGIQDNFVTCFGSACIRHNNQEVNKQVTKLCIPSMVTSFSMVDAFGLLLKAVSPDEGKVIRLSELPDALRSELLYKLQEFFNKVDITSHHYRSMSKILDLWVKGHDTVKEQARFLGVDERTVIRYRSRLDDLITNVFYVLFRWQDPELPIRKSDYNYQLVEYTMLTERDEDLPLLPQSDEPFDYPVVMPVDPRENVSSDSCFTARNVWENLGATGSACFSINTQRLAIQIVQWHPDILLHHFIDELESDKELLCVHASSDLALA